MEYKSIQNGIGYISRINGELKKTVLAGLVAVVLAGGCSSDTGFRVKLLDVSAGHQNSIYRKSDDRTKTDRTMFQEDCQPYDDSTISNGALKNSPIWRYYKSRKTDKQVK